jgi:D-serine deaminase-like pyridoxal phosphate-dependent protein
LPREWTRFKGLLRGSRLPAALVDLEALEANVDLLVSQMGPGPVTMRVASKSVRHVGLLRRILDRGGDRMQGLMCFTAYEAAFLAEQGFDDLFIAYPFARADEADEVAKLAAGGTRVVATIDAPGHVPILAAAAAARQTTIEVVVDVDLSWRPLGQHFGVRRSPIRSAEQALTVGRAVRKADGVRLVGVLGYEAQVAGMGDRTPGSRALDPIRQWIKRNSRPLATELRNQVVGALRSAGHDIRLVNGGGTGSVAFTAHDGSVTEVTAGSGFLCPHLFDHYDGLPLRPAAFFALQVVRSSDLGFITCLGGGYPASGEAGASRLPKVHLPRGLHPIDLEGWGEVQTPMKWRGEGPPPALGEPVLARHAKAGELAERFDSYLLVRGDEVVAREPTYRGHGHAFL